MKREILHLLYGMIGAVLLLLAGASCSSESPATDGGTDADADKGAYMAIRLPRSKTSSGADAGRQTSLSEDYEATVSSLALLLKTADDEVKMIYKNENLDADLHLADSWLRISLEQLPANLQMKNGQELYAVANYTGSSTLKAALPAVGETASLSTLLDLSADDLSIITEEEHAKKKFIMSAQTTLDIANENNPSGRIALVELERVAVKVRLTIKLEKPSVLPNEKVFIEWVPNENQPPMAKLRNKVQKGKLFGTQTTVNNEDIYKGGTSSFDEYESMNEISRADDGQNATYSVVTYTYPHVWKAGDGTNESSLLVNVPFAYRTKDESTEVSNEEMQNYYTVHFARTEARLERNTFYDVTVTIRMIGAQQVKDAIQVSGNVSTLPDWELENLYIDIENHYIYVEDDEFEMVNYLSFDFQSSEVPEMYFYRESGNSSYSNPSVWNKYYQAQVYNWTDKDTDAAIHISISGCNNTMTKDRLEVGNPPGVLQEFNMDLPCVFSLTLVAGKVLKTVRVHQYPHVHFFLKGYTLDPTDITKVTPDFDPSIIILRQGRINYYSGTDVVDEYYSYIAGTVEEEYTDTEGTWVRTHNQEDVQAYMARHFQVDEKDIEVKQTGTHEGELLFSHAQEACLNRQKASKQAGDNPVKRWRLPTVKELLVMNEAKLSYHGYAVANNKYSDYKTSLWNEFARPLSEDGHEYFAFGAQASTDGNRAYIVYDSRLKKAYPIGESTEAGYFADKNFEAKGVEAFKDNIVTSKSYYVRCVRTMSEAELESMTTSVNTK